MITVRKLKLTIIEENDEIKKEKYKFIRDSIYAQYQGLNLAMSKLSNAFFLSGRDLKSDLFKDTNKNLKNSDPIFDEIEFGKGIDSKSMITQKVKNDFKASIKNGLAKGERTTINYKRTFPLMTRGRDLKFSYNEDNEIIISWVNKIKFKVICGRQDKDYIELMHSLNKIISKEYKVKQSSIMFDKRNRLILNLTFDIPENINTKDIVPGRTLGVDLGIKYPAYICLNDNTYTREHVGEVFELLKARTQFRNRRKRLQEQLKNTNGGKGRNKKLKALNSLKEKEANFAKTYNHVISSRIIKFAKKNNCEFINIENLTKNGFDSSVLGNWSYYQLQEMINYKAERNGIIVRKVDPAFTSQTCSKCGYIDKENRETQEIFICKNCGFKLNADHNAAINISRKTDFIK